MSRRTERRNGWHALRAAAADFRASQQLVAPSAEANRARRSDIGRGRPVPRRLGRSGSAEVDLRRTP
jgi:hypothetical protein